MAQDQLAPATLLDENEIPVYVVRPTESRVRDAVAPRVGASSWEVRRASRLAFWLRLKRVWQNRLDTTVSLVTPLSAALDPGAALRYEATVTPSATLLGRKLRLGAAAFVVFSGGLACALAQPNQQTASASQAPVAGAIAAGAAKHAQPEAAAKTKTPVALTAAAPQADAKPQGPARRSDAIHHVVKRGESFLTIGAKYKLTPRTVRIANDLPLGATLQPGQKLVIPPVDGAYHRVKSGEALWIIARRYGVAEAAIVQVNPRLSPALLQPGQRVLIPGFQDINGMAGASAAKPAAPKATAVEAPGPARNTRVGKRLQASRSLAGAFGSRVGALSWPASGQMSSGFGARGRSFHPGLDICNQVGTTIRAAKAGTVIKAGWNGAYGYAVDIDHGGGVVTRYAHCSKLHVAAGQVVEAGERIAAMGSTGRSTGPHVHFEVRINGRPVNPSTFL